MTRPPKFLVLNPATGQIRQANRKPEPEPGEVVYRLMPPREAA